MAFSRLLNVCLCLLAWPILFHGCAFLQPWAPAELSEAHRAERRGFFGWTTSGFRTSSNLFNRCEGCAGCRVGVTGVELRSPEGEDVAVDCCVAKGERIVEQSGHRWTVDRDDHLCELRAGEDVLGTLVVRRRDDRRLVGRLELDGQVVKLGATDRKASPGHTAPWEMIPNGKAGAWELDLDGRLVGVVGTGPQALLQVTPDLPEAQRRAVGCAATVLAVLQIDSLGAGP